MSLLQVLQREPTTRSLPIGPVVTARCQGRCCPSRTAPVFVSLGVRGALLLCAECRAWQQAIIRAALPEIRRPR